MSAGVGSILSLCAYFGVRPTWLNGEIVNFDLINLIPFQWQIHDPVSQRARPHLQPKKDLHAARMISDMSTLNDFPWVSLNSCSSYSLTDKLICAKLTEISGPSSAFLCKICNQQLKKKKTRNTFVSLTIRRDSRCSGSCAETCHES